ncbi:hypothetical protein DYB37_000509 [Aphanomyces astaci]|uniref:U2A'/phosphoprotein 32 family A C-terminal domain-containing protein n=1 Tax=Aphanomyces astaci TaxID=112090 RepID=A0A418FG49_APHAT|nr:hypothetical protein DYB37_000509 [Aphanomyces astaci]
MEASRRRKKKRSHAAITMMDVIKANGMRVVEGTKLNLVAKGIDIIGTVVHAIAQSTTCLYLSQNNIASLDGLAQFTRLKVLSLGGNLLARFDAFDKLAPHLASLRTLHLSGNPLCDAPNYRLRLIYVLPMVHILDGADVTAKEREIAPFLVAQDASLRHVVFENHADISKLEWIVLLIQMHKEFYQVVYGAHGSPLRYVHRVCHVSHSRIHRCNARMPHLEKMAVDVALLLRLWKQADSTTNSSVDHSLVEGQLQRVVVRAHHHLQQHPLRKAKQLLQKFGSQRLKGLEPPSPPTWEEAYASVISLQQNTIAKLRGLCERNRRDLIDALKSLLIRDPGHRLQQARLDDEQRRHDLALDRELLLREYQGHSGTPHNNNDVCFHPGLPPQQPDPDASAQGRDSMDGALQRQLELVEKRLADLNMGQDEERRVRLEETAALEQKLRDMHHAPHRQFHVRLFAASRDHNGLVRCFHKWANASRFHAITAFAAGRRARDRLVTVHCRIKLERRVWHAWATATATHLVVRKQHKRSALTLAFHSYRVAVRKQSARRHVLRRTDHLATRQALHWVQQCMTRWRVYALQRRKPVGLLRFVRAQQRHGMMGRLWSCWRQQCYKRLEKRVETAEDAATYSEAERTRVVSEMLQLNDTTIQLAEQVATWKDACKEKDDAVRAWQQSCHEMDRAKAALQQQVEALNQRMVEMDQARRDQDRLAQVDTTQVLQQLAAAEDSNEGLRRQLRDGHDALLQVQQQLLKEREKLQRHSDDRRKAQHQLDLKHEEVTALQQSLQAVQQTLATERAERRDAAARCKDYETRLADTVRAIHEHESDMDSQLRHTHDVALDMERRWKESEVKNAELVKLLQEKNNCVAALTSQVHTHRSVESHRVSALLEEVQANIQKNTPPPDVDYPRSSPSAVEIDDLNTHTASIHDDIKALQNRIMLRLQQSPVDAAAPSIPSSRISKPQDSAPKGKQRGGKLPTQKPPVSKPKPK